MTSTTLPNSFTLRFVNPTSSADSISLFGEGFEPKSSVVFTQQVNGVTYEEILQSQNGANYQVNGLTINIVSAPSEGVKTTQLLNPFIFTKKDVNGNEMRVEKFQSIDPYQYQYSYSFVNLVDEGEVFVLDGNTEFTYKVEGNTQVNVTFNYIEVKNSTFETEEGEKELIKDIENDLQLQEESQTKGDIKLDVLEDNASVITKKKSKSNWLWWLIGGTAVFLFINPFKSNQK
jgi:hypothetical protein